jgi:hypothetical protein
MSTSRATEGSSCFRVRHYHPYCYVTSSDISYEDHRLAEPLNR